MIILLSLPFYLKNRISAKRPSVQAIGATHLKSGALWLRIRYCPAIRVLNPAASRSRSTHFIGT